MFGGDGLSAVQVGDGARYFEDTVVRSGGESHSAYRHFECAFTGSVEGALCADQANGHARIGVSSRLPGGADAFHPRADLGRALARRCSAEFLVRHGGDFHVNVDAVEQGAADLAQVTLNQGGGAPALARGISVKAAGACVQIAIGLLNGYTDRRPASGRPNEPR